jgi:hypothetical protein
MSSFISNFRSIAAALAAIVAIEAAVYAARPSTLVERSNYLDWNHFAGVPFHRALIYEKLNYFANSSPDIVQVGDSSGFHGVIPEIVMQYLNGMKYLNLSCCANTGFDGYYAIAEFMLRRNPSIKTLVLYMSLNNVPRDDLTGGDWSTEAAESIRNAFDSPWAYLSPPSMALRRWTTDAAYSLWGFLRPRATRLFGNDEYIDEMAQSVRRHYGWWPEHDPRLAGPKLEQYWRELCGDDGIAVREDDEKYYAQRMPFGRLSRTRLALGRFADLAARHGARLAIVFQPFACHAMKGSFLAARRADLEWLRATHDNVLVLPESVFEPWPTAEFVSYDHLRVGRDEKNSRRVGRLLAGALGIPIMPDHETVASEAADGGWSAAAPIKWADRRFAAEAWRSDGAEVRQRHEGAAGAAEPAQLIEGIADGFHRVETRIENIEPGRDYVISIVAKPLGSRWLRMETRDADGAGHDGHAECDVQSLTAQRGGTMLDVGLDLLPDGWFRCWAAMSFGGKAAALDIGLMKGPRVARYRGDGKSGAMLDGVQLWARRRP